MFHFVAALGFMKGANPSRTKEIAEDIERWIINQPFVSFTFDKHVFSIDVQPISDTKLTDAVNIGYTLEIISAEIDVVDFLQELIHGYMMLKYKDEGVQCITSILFNAEQHFPRQFSLACAPAVIISMFNDLVAFEKEGSATDHHK